MREVQGGDRPLTSQLRAVALVVLDSVGIGGAPDAADFGDAGSATLPHIADAVGGLDLPNLEALGLGRITPIQGVAALGSGEGRSAVRGLKGSFGAMIEVSPGKDTTTGHWEIAGVVLKRPFPTYPDGFPAEVISAFESATSTEVLGNVAASGTEIIDRLGAEHLATGRPIVYTSADSVFQIAAHVEVIPLERLYEMCRVAREILRGPHEVGRVIARPFMGTPGDFTRTPDRHDFSVLPPGPTVLDRIASSGREVRAIGKISDIFAGRGVTSSRPTRSNDEGADAVAEEIGAISSGLVFANLVDFDQAFGHRNDPDGYAAALKAFDDKLPAIIGALGDDDALIITADHGNDPTTESTDHSRERVPLLVTGPGIASGVDLGERASFADCGATIAEFLNVQPLENGTSFAASLAP